MKRLFYTAAVTALAAVSLSMTSSTHADETSGELKYAAKIEHFYRAASITSFKDYRDIKKEAEAKLKAEEAKKKAEEEAAKKAEDESKKKAEEEAKKAEDEAKKKAEEKRTAEEAAKQSEESSSQSESYSDESSSYSTVQTSTERLYSLSDFMFSGVVYWSGYKFTYYSQSVLPGGGLSIPGRHVNADGYVSDGDGYIVLAGSAPLGTVYDTPFGYKGKIYDRGTSGNHLDVYIR